MINNEERYGVAAEMVGSTRVGGYGYLNEGLASSLLSKQIAKNAKPGTAKFLMDRVHLSRPHVAGHTTHRTNIPYSDIHRMYTFEQKEHMIMLAIESDLPDMHFYQSYKFRSNEDYVTAKRLLLGEITVKGQYEREVEPEVYYKPIKKVMAGYSPTMRQESIQRLDVADGSFPPGDGIRSSTRSSRPGFIYVNNVGFSEGTVYHEKLSTPVLSAQSSAPRAPVVIYPLGEEYRRTTYVEERPRDYTIHRVPSQRRSISTTNAVPVTNRAYGDELILRRISRINPGEYAPGYRE